MKKVKIKTLPVAKNGVDAPAMGLNAHTFPWPGDQHNLNPDNDIKVNNTLQPVDRSESNVEAEKGETVVGNMTGDGIPEHYIVGGKSHSQGGTPLKLPTNAFVFSKDKKLTIKDDDLLKDLGSSKAAVPADLAKKYNINDYKKILSDPDADKLQKSTAEAMIANYNMKLAKLALAQESMKGFPTGIPQIAIPYVMATQLDPGQLFGATGQEQMPLENNMKKGGQYMGPGGTVGEEDGVDPWFSKTKEGKTSPTGLNSDAQYTQTDYERLFKERGIDTDKLTPAQAQKALYEKSDAFHKAYMWGAYGDTKHGGTKSKFEKYAPLKDESGRIIENYTDYKARMSKTYDAETLNKELGNYLPKFTDSKHGARVAFLLNPPTDEPLAKPQEVINNSNVNNLQVSQPPITHLTEKQVPATQDPWWLQDIIKTTGAAADLWRIKKYNPWQATAGVVLPDPTFYDPNRELAAIGEQMNIGTQGAQIFTGPQAYNARVAQMQGQAAKSVADSLGRYNNLNVGVANQFEMSRTGIMNQASQQQAAEATQLFDKYTIANQQFDNSKNMARQNLRQSYIDAITNKNETASINEMYPQFNIDPMIGGKVSFTGKGKALKNSPITQDTVMKKAQDYMNNHPGLEWKQAIDLAKTELTGKGYTEPEDEMQAQFRQLMAMQGNQGF